MFFLRKTIFHLDLTKDAQKVTFIRKVKKLLHAALFLNKTPLNNSMSQNHLGLKLDININFLKHIKDITQKCSKTMGLLRKIQPVLLGSSLLTLYEIFIRCQISSMTKNYNFSFHEEMLAWQYLL